MSWADTRHVRLRILFARRDVTGRPDLPMLSVYRDYGVVPRESRDDNYNKPGEDPSAYRVVRSGDLVLNKMKTWQGSLGISDFDGIVSPAYFVARPLTDDCPAFLHYLLRSAPLIAEYGARSKGIRPSQWDLPWEEFQNISVDLPSVTTQRAIADYLDRETARIDALIAAKRQLARLISDRTGNWLTRQYDSYAHRFGLIKLKYLVRGLRQGWSPQCEDRLPDVGEWSVIKAGAVNGGKFHSAERKTLPTSEIVRREYLLHPGDLLINRANGSLDNLGSAAVIPCDAPERTLLCDKVFRVELAETQVDTRWLAAMLGTAPAREAMLLGVSGAEGMANSLPTSVILNIEVPNADLGDQIGFVDSWSRLRRRRQGNN